MFHHDMQHTATWNVTAGPQHSCAIFEDSEESTNCLGSIPAIKVRPAADGISMSRPMGCGSLIARLAAGLAPLFLVAAGAAQAPLSLPIAADGDFDLPPGAKLFRYEIRKLAGTGEYGYGGDGGVALRATLATPTGVATDSDGNVYLIDKRNDRVRRIDVRTGEITTIAELQFWNQSIRRLYDDQRSRRDWKLDWSRIENPGLAVDGEGNVFYSVDDEVFRIDATTGAIEEISTLWPYRRQVGLAVDAAGRLYVRDKDASVSHVVMRIDPETGEFRIVSMGRNRENLSAPIKSIFYSPGGMAVDAKGDVYLADTSFHRVLRIDSLTGVLSAFAGTGERGFSGDGGPASMAQFCNPDGVAVDAEGNVYVADTGNHRVRRIDSETGVIDTFAGDGNPGFPWEEAPDGVPPEEARLYSPRGVAVDAAGNVFVTEGNRVRIVRRSQQIRLPLGSSGEDVLLRVAQDGALTWQDGDPVRDGERVSARNGDEYMFRTESVSGRVVSAYVPATETVTLTEGGYVDLKRDEDGTWRIDSEPVAVGSRYSRGGSEYLLLRSEGAWELIDAREFLSIAVESSGVLAPPDGVELERVMVIETLAGKGEQGYGGDRGPAAKALLSLPRGLAVDTAGNVYVADLGNDRVRKISASTGWIETVAGVGTWGRGGDGGLATAAFLVKPSDVVVDSAGHLYIADGPTGGVRKVDAVTGRIETIAGTAIPFHDWADWWGGGPAVNVEMMSPHTVGVDGAGNVYAIGDSDRHVRKVDVSTGAIEVVAGSAQRGYDGDDGPAIDILVHGGRRIDLGLAVDAAGNVFLADAWNHRVLKVEASTGITTTLAGTGAEGFSGDGGPAGEARLRFPLDVAVDAEGNLYIADTGNRAIRRIDSKSGIIQTLAGTGHEGFSGDGGPALAARFLRPIALATDSSGKLYVTDLNRVRVIRPAVLVSVPLDATGQSIYLEVARDGVLYKEGHPVLDREEVTAANGERYLLSRSGDGTFQATHLPTQR